jgi:hypothetical protein
VPVQGSRSRLAWHCRGIPAFIMMEIWDNEYMDIMIVWKLWDNKYRQQLLSTSGPSD